MRSRPIAVDDTRQELTSHSIGDFPMSMDEQRVADEGCRQIQHWHYEIQIVLMTRGSAIFETPAGRYRICTGEGIFLNSGVLHQVIPTEEPDSVYICVNFKPELIHNRKDTVIWRDYIQPVLSSPELRVFQLQQEPWHQEILRILPEMAEVNDAQEYGYEILLETMICRIWYLILTNNRLKTEKMAVVSFADKQRIRMLKTYIHHHYMEHLTLAKIAEAGHISRSECCRVFRRTEQTTPIVYLKRYRISQSMKLLTCTDLSISEIAFRVGFESNSYFTECFKQEAGCAPNEYRHQKIEGRGGSPGFAQRNAGGQIMYGGNRIEDQEL